ncbi:hypothetical protein J4Q44_G00232330 [Coregonus suidteri]|uniref:Peroxisomal membrane protein 2 n=1 Tax=Coregonus suidteri TaxID=861788 RepID=A0AAN8LAX7_9TELE
MPVQSLPIRDSALYVRLLHQYLILLKNYPILTKSVTSGILSAMGNLISQALEAKRKAKEGTPVKEIDISGPARFAIYGLLITGPVSHYFYQLMEVLMPTTVPYCMVKRLFLDRLIFAPAFLLLFFFVMNILEGKSWADFQSKFININYVAVEFRVLFANMVALFWYAYLASVRK